MKYYTFPCCQQREMYIIVLFHHKKCVREVRSDWRGFLQAERKYEIAKLRAKGPDYLPNLQVPMGGVLRFCLWRTVASRMMV